MSKCSCKSSEKPATTVNESATKKPATADQCKDCGLDYCDSEVCDCEITVQVPPSK